MNLYSLTLQPATGIHKAIYGNFSGTKAQEIVVSKVKYLELWRVNENSGKLQTVLTQEVFGLIRCIVAFRLPGSNKDQMIIGTDSGRVVILQYNPERNQFEKVHQETYGKTGCRRIVPGQYLAIDPKGRAFMISAVEKNKFVYILTRENEHISISSPLEAPKSHTIVFDIVGLDAGYDNALFAAIEVDYGDWQDKDSCQVTGKCIKFLTIYEMDFGLNTVKRKSSDVVPETAHQLLSVPYAPDGPGGVIILCEDFLIYRGNKGAERRVPYPKRISAPHDRGAMIGACGYNKQKDRFFYLIQNEYGDLFDMQFHFTHEDVHNITLQYFDSIPVAINLCITKKGGLFAPCERGNHNFYQFISLGKDEDQPIITDSTMKYNDQVYFTPRNLKHLKLSEEFANFSCITEMKVEDLAKEGNPQIYMLCGAGSRSTLRILRHGLAIAELASSPLPGKPLAIWTIKKAFTDLIHRYIILSFLNQTLVLSIGDKVEEAHDSGLDNGKQTIHVSVLEDNSVIQVVPNGIKHIKKAPQHWIVEGKVIKASSNQRQVALGLTGGEIYYYELGQDGMLVEIAKQKMESEVTALDIGPIEEGRQRSRFLAVGLNNHTVQLLSLDPESCLEGISMQDLPSQGQAESLCMMEMLVQDEQMTAANLFLFIGMNNGILVRSSVDTLYGKLEDTRMRYLGTKQVKCFRVQANGGSAMLALTSRPWLCYNYQGKIYMQPLSSDALDHAASFNSSTCSDGVVGISGNHLKIIVPVKYGELFNETSINLQYTPRKMATLPESQSIVIIESDNRAYSQKEKAQKMLEIMNGNQEALQVPESQVGPLMAPSYKWAACLRLLAFNKKDQKYETYQVQEFENNEHACSLCLIQFSGYEEEYLCVGTVKDLENEPQRKFTEGYIHTFVLENKGTKVTLLHTTPLDEVPYSIASWRGRLLIGAGKNLRVYEMGKKRLLKKAELKNLNSFITSIHVKDDRIFLTESADSIHLLRYKIKEQTFMEIADDILPRYITASVLVDYHTMVAGDKFENVFVSRVPLDIDEEQEEHPYEFKMKMDQGCMNGAPFKMNQICNFYVGEILTSLQKTSLVSTGNEVVVYGTTMGSIGALYPFDNREDIDFFLHLEMYMRAENLPISGRDHMMFRSFYGPCKSVIDGDLCEQFANMPYSKQKIIAESFDRTPTDVIKKLQDIRYKIL